MGRSGLRGFAKISVAGFGAWVVLANVAPRAFLHSPRSLSLAFARSTGVGSYVLACVSSAIAATAGKVVFNLPADLAEKSLRLFSRQSGAEVVFASDVAKGVRTQPVKGELPARQALEAMLKGTGLVVFEDKSGAFSIQRAPAKPSALPANKGVGATKAAGSARTDPAQTSASKPMKRNTVLSRLAAVVALVVGGPAGAQNASDATGSIEGRVLNRTQGQYLNNARVAIAGTTISTFTDQGGFYRLAGVPAGAATVRASYTGLAEASAAVTVAAGRSVTADFALVSSTQPVGPEGRGDTLRLDPFVVTSQRETNASNIATNEQRVAANIKNVVASDAFGDVTEGNVGEFVKYLPGVTVDYVAADVRTISVRGFADNFTNVTADGAQMASSASGGAIRTFELEQVSINNVSRVEVTKVPMPEQPANSLGGSVNMVSRSAFESARPVFRYRVYASVNSEDFDSLFRRTPGPHRDATFKSLPGFDFNYIAPLTKNFGLVVNGLTSSQFNEQHRAAPTWVYSGAGATLAAPYLRNFQMQDGPKTTHRHSGSVKADWRPLPGHVLSASVQANYYYAYFGNRNINFDPGAVATPTTADGASLTFGPTFTHGASGRGVVTQNESFFDKYGATWGGNLRHRFTSRRWEIDSGLSLSRSKYWMRADGRGHFSAVSTALQGVSRVLYDDYVQPVPRSITVLNPAGQPIDLRDPNNYRITTVATAPANAKDEIEDARVNTSVSGSCQR